MISKLAIADLNRMKKDGLEPTPEDIIRLNALALRLEGARKRNALNSLDYLPRIAQITPTIAFRQPTIGHEIWLDRVEQMTEANFETALAVKAFALSRPADALPDADDPSCVENAVREFTEQFKDLTREQIYAALDYVIFGTSQTVGEYAEPEKDEDEREPDGEEEDDWKACVAVGILREGQAILWGMSQKEMESLTRRQLTDLIKRAYFFQKIEYGEEESARLSDYYRTLDAITGRLKGAKNDK